MSSEPVISEPQQRGERSSHTGSVADSQQVFIAMLVSWPSLNKLSAPLLTLLRGWQVLYVTSLVITLYQLVCVCSVSDSAA